MSDARPIEQVQLVTDAAQSHRPPLGDEHFDGRRQHTTERDVGDPGRLEQPRAVSRADPRSGCSCRAALDQRPHLALGQSHVARDRDVPNLERRRA